MCFFYYLASIPLAVVVFAVRRRYLRAAPSVQWTVALAAVAASAISIGSIVLTD
jgi:hypothetical protein